jgi:hypothetical protein
MCNVEETLVYLMGLSSLFRRSFHNQTSLFHKMTFKASVFIVSAFVSFKNTMTYDVRNPGPSLGQSQKCGGV